MLELLENTTSTVDPQTIDRKTDAEIDALPFGVIGLDPDGVILRYNLYESRLARLDRNQVVGKRFFTEIAPCTRNEAFEGRFRGFVARGGRNAEGGLLERFDFVFDFRFGAQDVSVDIVRAGEADRYYLLINRRKIAPPRPGIPAAQLAAEQKALAPREGEAGVRRDAVERRYVDAPASLLGALRATCDRLAPESWPLFSLEWGTQWGRRIAVELEADALEHDGKSLRELPMREVARRVAGYFSERGWGAARFDLSHAEAGIVAITFERSALAEAAPAGRRGEGRACHLLAGAHAAILSSIAGRRLVGRELSCACGGNAACTVIVTGHERRDRVDDAMRSGAHTLEGLRANLEAGDPARPKGTP